MKGDAGGQFMKDFDIISLLRKKSREKASKATKYRMPQKEEFAPTHRAEPEQVETYPKMEFDTVPREPDFNSDEIFTKITGSIEKLARTKKVKKILEEAQDEEQELEAPEDIEDVLDDMKELSGERKALLFGLQEFYSQLGPGGNQTFFDFTDIFEEAARSYDATTMREYGRRLYQTSITLFAYYTKIFENQNNMIKVQEEAIEMYNKMLDESDEELEAIEKRLEKAEKKVDYKKEAKLWKKKHDDLEFKISIATAISNGQIAPKAQAGVSRTPTVQEVDQIEEERETVKREREQEEEEEYKPKIHEPSTLSPDTFGESSDDEDEEVEEE
jgi:hypothetical protein